MALREAALRVRFAGGIDTDSDPKAIPAVKLAALENGVFDKASAIKKRNGYANLSQTIDGSADLANDSIRTATRGNELLEFSRTRCRSRQSQSGADQLSDAGPVFSVVGTDRPLVRTGTQQTMPDHATLDGVTVSAWEDSAGGVWWSVTDAVNGRVFRAATQADANGRSPRCVAVGVNLHVYYAVPTQRRVMVLVIDPASPAAAVTPAILIEDLDSTQSMYDACPTGRSGMPAVIAWFEHGTTAIRIGYVDDSGVLGSPLNGHPSVVTHPCSRAATSPIGIAYRTVDGGDDDRLGLAFVTGTSGTLSVWMGGIAGTTTISEIDNSTDYVATDVRRVAVEIATDPAVGLVVYGAWEEAAAAASNRFVVVTEFNFIDSVTTTLQTIRSVGLASRAFVVNEQVFAVFVHDTTYFNTYVTLRLSDLTPVGRHVPASAAGAPPRQHLSSAHVSTDDVVTIALPFRERVFSENNDKFRETGVRLFTLDFDSDDSHQTAQLGAGLYMAGACPMHYDGRVWTEQGFHFGPELIVATPAAGGSMTASTTYLYRVWYESTDAQGEVHLGPTSIGTIVTMAGGETQVTLTLPTLRVTRKGNVRICVARSRAANTGKTAELFRVTSLDPTTAGAAANGFVANSTSVDTVTFVDRMSDADLANQEPLYTNGGVLSNDPAPLGNIVAGLKGRLLFTDPSDGNTVRFTHPLDPGYGIETPPDLALSCDPFGGDITAIATRDDRAFLFKRDAIFTFAGDGPAAGTGSTATTGFSSPQLLPGDVGCTDPASIVLTPFGHMFKSAKGIKRLAGDGTIEDIGAPVSSFNAQTVRRATVLPDRTHVLFLTDDGVSLLYDYRRDQWSTFLNHEGRDAAVVSGTYHYLRTDGRMFRETVGTHSDAGARIKLRFETAPLHLQEHLQGFCKFFELFLLGTWISAHQLGVQYRTDYTQQWNDLLWLDATAGDSATGWITGENANTIGEDPIDGTGFGDGGFGDGPFGGSPDDLYQWRIDLYEKGSSIQFAFEDFEADGLAGASFELVEMVLTGGVKRNAPKPFTAARSI